MSTSQRIVHFHSSAYSVSFHGPALSVPIGPKSGPMDGTSSGVHGMMVLGLPGGGRGEHRRPLPHASWRLSPCALYGHSTLQQAIVALASRRLYPSSPPQAVQRAWPARQDRALLCPESERARGAAQPSQDGAARGPSGACRAAARRVGVIEGGPLARATVRVSGGYSLPDARRSRSGSRTCSPRADSP